MLATRATRCGGLLGYSIRVSTYFGCAKGRRDANSEIDGKGIIQIDDLRRVATELGEGLDEEELSAMIDEFDLEGKGGVGEEEFIAIVLGT